MARGKVITTHLRTGDPNGIRTVFISNKICVKNKGLVPVSHKNIINPAVGKEQTAKGGVLYGGNVQPLAISRLLVMSYLTEWVKEIVSPSETADVSSSLYMARISSSRAAMRAFAR